MELKARGDFAILSDYENIREKLHCDCGSLLTNYSNCNVLSYL